MENNEQNLNEDTTGASVDNIAVTDENLAVDIMFQEARLPSLGRQIFSVLPLHGPTGAIFNLLKKDSEDDFKLLRSNVEVFPSEAIHTGMTQESIQDVLAMYGKDGRKIVGRLLRGLANDQENVRTQTFLEAESEDITDLNLSESKNAEINLFEITQRVHELVLKANSKNIRTYEAFCVIPYVPAGGLVALSQYASGGEIDPDSRGLFLTKIGLTKFYLNPWGTNMCYVGLKDVVNPSKSSAVFSPYQSHISEAIHQETGESGFHIFNRFALTASPLHRTNNEMMFKFLINY